jgi:hypothetical protein
VSDKRKRKRRRPAVAAGAPPPPAVAQPRKSPAVAQPRKSHSETKDAAVRAALVPLREGERPVVVTVAAVVALLLAVGNLAAYAAGWKVDGQRPPVATVAFQALLMLTAAWGMWHVRYWAVLGMEAILAILIVILAVLLLKASTVATALILLAVMVPAGVLFWKLVKAMARIQMPERR